jgi:hypothetical protein
MEPGDNWFDFHRSKSTDDFFSVICYLLQLAMMRPHLGSTSNFGSAPHVVRAYQLSPSSDCHLAYADLTNIMLSCQDISAGIRLEFLDTRCALLNGTITSPTLRAIEFEKEMKESIARGDLQQMLNLVAPSSAVLILAGFEGYNDGGPSRPSGRLTNGVIAAISMLRLVNWL